MAVIGKNSEIPFRRVATLSCISKMFYVAMAKRWGCEARRGLAVWGGFALLAHPDNIMRFMIASSRNARPATRGMILVTTS